MTRCYEFYCMYKDLPEKCDLTSTGKCYANHYISLLRNVGINFNKETIDKDLFTMVNTPERVLRPVFDERNPIVRAKAEKEIISALNDKKDDGRGYKKPTTKSVVKLLRRLRREEKASNIVDRDPFDSRVIKCDISEAATYVVPNNASLILTDPPYIDGQEAEWESLGKFASIALKEGGVLIAYIGHAHLIEYANCLMKSPLNYVWTFALLHSGPCASVHYLHFKAKWKPIIMFVKGKYQVREGWFDDVIQGTGREKEDHDWQQASGELEPIVKYFSEEGDLIIDPFCGSGTTLLAAKRLKRNFIGMDKDEESVNTSKERLRING